MGSAPPVASTRNAAEQDLNARSNCLPTVNFMEYCHKCGVKLPEDAYFCPKCGLRTQKGVQAGVSTPWEEMAEAFSKMGKEMGKAFSAAAKEMQKAFQEAGRSVKESSSGKLVECADCGGNNPSTARFCRECGKELEGKPKE